MSAVVLYLLVGAVLTARALPREVESPPLARLDLVAAFGLVGLLVVLTVAGVVGWPLLLVREQRGGAWHPTKHRPSMSGGQHPAGPIGSIPREGITPHAGSRSHTDRSPARDSRTHTLEES